MDAGSVALAFLAVFVKTEEVNDDQGAVFRSIVDDVNSKTLGQIFKHVEGIATFDSSILSAIDEALEQRNYLMHKFFRTHNFAIHGGGG